MDKILIIDDEKPTLTMFNLTLSAFGYTVITAENGFSQPVSLSIEVNALMVFRQTYDLGVVQPPFPNSLTYEFTVPGNVPSGVTINGLLRASGGGIERQQTLTLQIA